MGVDALAFCFGGLLLFVAMIGGGFEVKELKVPRLSWVPRFVAGSLGALFILVGIGMQEAKKGSAQEAVMSVRDDDPRVQHRMGAGFSGLHASARVSWDVDREHYVALLQLWGQNGLADVRYREDEAEQLTIRQDLTLRATSAGWLYQGANVRDPVTNESRADSYSPDTFRIVQSQPGTWAVQDTCDTQGKCSPVIIEAFE